MPLMAVNAQDNRNRATSTIVSDALAQMPAETPAVYNQVMAELAATGAEGIEMLMTRVSECIGFRPDGYILIQMSGLEALVDTMGGVTFDVLDRSIKS